jgi:hypothetical protein
VIFVSSYEGYFGILSEDCIGVLCLGVLCLSLFASAPIVEGKSPGSKPDKAATPGGGENDRRTKCPRSSCPRSILRSRRVTSPSVDGEPETLGVIFPSEENVKDAPLSECEDKPGGS